MNVSEHPYGIRHYRVLTVTSDFIVCVCDVRVRVCVCVTDSVCDCVHAHTCLYEYVGVYACMQIDLLYYIMTVVSDFLFRHRNHSTSSYS